MTKNTRSSAIMKGAGYDNPADQRTGQDGRDCRASGAEAHVRNWINRSCAANATSQCASRTDTCARGNHCCSSSRPSTSRAPCRPSRACCRTGTGTGGKTGCRPSTGPFTRGSTNARARGKTHGTGRPRACRAIARAGRNRRASATEMAP